MKKFLSVACLLALFIGCGNEANAEKCPSWKTSKDGSFNRLTLQSNDDVIIKGMTINRGNCAYANKYLAFYEFDVSNSVSEVQKQENEAHNKWLKTAKKDSGMPMIKFKNGKNLWYSSDEATKFSIKLAKKLGTPVPFIYTFGTSKKKTDSEKMFEELDELSKGAFYTHQYLIGKTFSFGEKISFDIDCNYNDVIEVRLDTNLGECVMPKNR